MRRRRVEPAAAHSDRWLVSYADFITLLFAFFTTMYAISNVDRQKALNLQRAMNGALNLHDTPAAPSVAPSQPPHKPPPVAPKGSTERLRSLARELSQIAGSTELKGRVQVRTEKRGVVVSLAETGFFEVGRAEVRHEALAALDLVAVHVREHDAREPLEITVAGHTDDRPVRGGRFRSNLELSTARATFVVQRLVNEHGFLPGRVAASGYGEWRPVGPNDSPEGRARNRRVDLLLQMHNEGENDE